MNLSLLLYYYYHNFTFGMSVTKNSQLERESFPVLSLSGKILISLAHVGNKMFSENSRFVMLSEKNTISTGTRTSALLYCRYCTLYKRSGAVQFFCAESNVPSVSRRPITGALSVTLDFTIWYNVNIA